MDNHRSADPSAYRAPLDARTLKAFCSAAQGCPTRVGQPWVREKESARTLKGFCRTLIPEVALIELNAVFPEEAPELVLERFFAMVLILVPNVFLQDDMEIDLAERLRHRMRPRWPNCVQTFCTILSGLLSRMLRVPRVADKGRQPWAALQNAFSVRGASSGANNWALEARADLKVRRCLTERLLALLQLE
jgi:hypothetical protein